MLMVLVQGPHFENHCKRKFLVEILVIFGNTLKIQGEGPDLDAII